MSIELSESQNPYGGRTPFDVLGVRATATAEELRDARNQLVQEANDQYADDRRACEERKREIDQAYEQVRTPKKRAAVELFLLDSTLGRQDARAAAEPLKEVRFDFRRILRGGADSLAGAAEIPVAARAVRLTPLDEAVRPQTEARPFPRETAAAALEPVAFHC